MKKYLLAVLLLLGVTSYSQEVTIKNPNNFSTITEAIKNSTLTTKFVMIKGIKYPIYTTSKGSYFIIYSKENFYYRRYVKIEE